MDENRNLNRMEEFTDNDSKIEELSFEEKKELADSGNMYAQYRVYKAYEDGDGVEKNIQLAKTYCKMAAENGHVAALCVVAGEKLYSNKTQEAIILFERAHEKGFNFATYMLGDIYTNERLPEFVDFNKGMHYLNIAAEADSRQAQTKLGYLYFNGKGIAQNYSKAMFWFEKAASKGDAFAQNFLGAMFFDGLGVEQDKEKAAYYYEQASKQGIKSATIELADMLAFGDGVIPNYEKAAVLYNEIINSNNKDYYERAIINIGYMYGDILKDDNRAFPYYLQGAQNGIASAQHTVGVMYHNGEGTPKNDNEAIFWYKKAAAQGYQDSEHNLDILLTQIYGPNYKKIEEKTDNAKGVKDQIRTVNSSRKNKKLMHIGFAIIIIAIVIFIALIAGIVIFAVNAVNNSTQKESDDYNSSINYGNSSINYGDSSNEENNFIEEILKSKITVPPYEKKEISIEKVDFLTFNGYIEEGQKNTHSFIAPETGRYGILISDLQEGLELDIVSYEDAQKKETETGLKRGSEQILYYNVKAGTKCEITVGGHYGKGSGNYTIVIGQQKKSVDVSEYIIVSDSVEFKDQKNVYYYTAKENGKYCIKITSIIKGNEIKVSIYDDYGDFITECKGDRDTYLSAYLEKGKTYEIIVTQWTGLDDYTLEILPQKPTIDVSNYQEISDCLEFEYQKNFYNFTPKKESTYKIIISHIQNGYEVDVCILDNEGYEMSEGFNMARDEEISCVLEKGHTYTIEITGDKLCEYSFEIVEEE